MNKYSSVNPPLYPLENITTDVYLLYSNNDWISSGRDVHRLCEHLQSCTEKLIGDGNYSHLDYTFAKDAKKAVYGYIKEEMKKYLENSS